SDRQQRWRRAPGASPRIRDDLGSRDRQSVLLDGTLAGAPQIAWSSGDVVSFRPAGGNDLAVLRGHDDNVSAAAFLPDGKRVVTAGLDGTLRLWNLEPARNPIVEIRHAAGSPIGHALFLSGGRQVISAPARDRFSTFAGRSLALWDAATGALVT